MSCKPRHKVIGLVNDNAELMAGYTRHLVNHDYSVVPMIGGREALELLSKMEFIDLLLVDYSMPQMNGVEFLKELKRLQPSLYYRTRIIGFSGYSEGSTVAKDFTALGIEYTTKPDNEADFIAFVDTHLNRRKRIA